MVNLIKRIVEVFERIDVVVKIQDERPVLRGTPGEAQNVIACATRFKHGPKSELKSTS